MLSGRSQSQNDRYYMTALMPSIQSSQTQKQKGKGWLPGAGGEANGQLGLTGDRVSLLQDESNSTDLLCHK